MFYLLLVTSVHASHLAGEGWGCIDNSIYYQNPEGVDEIFQDCTDNQECKDASDPNYSSNAVCVDVAIDENQPSVVIPDDAPQDTTSSPPTIPSGVTSEEQAIYNLNRGLLPFQVIQSGQEKSKSFLDQVKDFLGGIFSGLFWNPNPPNSPEKLYVQSESLHQAEIPQNLGKETDQSKDVQGIKEDFETNLKGFLGGSSGFYGVSIPKFGNSDIKSSECLFENASFPAGINPITGREC